VSYDFCLSQCCLFCYIQEHVDNVDNQIEVVKVPGSDSEHQRDAVTHLNSHNTLITDNNQDVDLVRFSELVDKYCSRPKSLVNNKQFKSQHRVLIHTL